VEKNENSFTETDLLVFPSGSDEGEVKDKIVRTTIFVGYEHSKQASVVWLLNRLFNDFGGVTYTPYGCLVPNQPDYMFGGWGKDKGGKLTKDRVLIVIVDTLGDIDDHSLEKYFLKLKKDSEKKFEQDQIWIVFEQAKVLAGPGIPKYWSGARI
jgi:hypothetical protein